MNRIKATSIFKPFLKFFRKRKIARKKTQSDLSRQILEKIYLEKNSRIVALFFEIS